ncbi:MAG TPA: hypothetical protein VLC48_11700 [Gemmatimonadota bacterium]|nr:hypothetical protein [Gemmatimonadota bacterium]
MKAQRGTVLGLIIALAGLSGLAACEAGLLSIETLSGEYNLIAAEDSSLPATVQSSDTLVIEVMGGELLLLEIAQYSMAVDFRLSDPRAPDDTSTFRFVDVGPWAVTDQLVLLESTTPGRVWAGSVDGLAINLVVAEPDFLEFPITLRFRRVTGS